LVAASEQRADEAVRQVRAALRQAYADLVGAQLRATEMMASRDRLRGLAEVLGRREVAGDAAGYDRLRAEREVIEIEADLTAAGADRARAQAALAAFFAPTTDPATLVAAVPQAVVPRQALPTVEELMAHAESQLPELMALKHEQESASLAISAAGRRPIPEPEVVAGTKSSNVAGGDLGTVFSVHIAVPLFDRAKPEQALAQARRAQAEARIAAFQAVLHADLAALRTVVLQRRGAADSYRASTATSAAQLERIAQVSYDAGERSILELVDAYRNSGLTRLRQVALDAAVRNA
jgi:outer membrane protein TolC